MIRSRRRGEAAGPPGPAETPPSERVVERARRLAGLLGEAEDALADDVALDLARAAPDRLRAGEEERRHHRADRIAVAALVAQGAGPRPAGRAGVDEHGLRPEDVEGQ